MIAVIAAPLNLRLADSMGRTMDSTVTLAWTPPPNVASAVYTIGVDPSPESGDLTDTSLIQATITVLYNTPYTVTVSVNAPCGAQEVQRTFTLGNLAVA